MNWFIASLRFILKRAPRFASILLALAVLLVEPARAESQRPNILVIVADDMGWADVGYHGSEIKTPHIDALRAGGIELDQHYVAPMCTPTRTALLTGRYWSRFGNTSPSNERVLPWDTTTLASALKTVGYDTCITGKWHLGSLPEWGPRKFGFNHSHGALAGGVNPWSHLYKHGPYLVTWHWNDQLQEQEGHATDLIGEAAVKYIEMEREGPFFVYVPFTAVHTPFDEPEGWLESAAHIDEDRRQYAASVQHMDGMIGKMCDALREKGIFDETLILFFSDNGGTNGDDSGKYPDTKSTAKVKGLNHPLRGWKGQLYEGGIRVPALVHWPARWKPGKVTTPIHVVDWMPTLCQLTEAEDKPELKWDGRNLLPLLDGEVEDLEPRTLYWQGVRSKSAAVREGDWKLLESRDKKVKRELFNLAEDPNETSDRAADHPEIVERLLATLKAEEAKDNDALPKDDKE